MEIRVLRYFLAVAQLKSFSKAAELLYVSQPTLSRQVRDLERELGAALFERNTRSVSLTKAGELLKDQARQIVQLADATEALVKRAEASVSGEISLGCSESEANRPVMRAIARMRELHPRVTFRVTSGNAQLVTDGVDQGVFDVGVVVDPVNLEQYDYLTLPAGDCWGVLMRKDSDLAGRSEITPDDLRGKPLVFSSQEIVKNEIAGWIGGNHRALDVVATYTLLYNARLMAEEGVGYVLTLSSLVGETDESPLCFRPLAPQLVVKSRVIWRKYQTFAPEVEAFLQVLHDEIDGQAQRDASVGQRAPQALDRV